MKLKNILYYLTVLISTVSLSNLARHDIDYEEYENFALSLGAFSYHQKGTRIYSKDGQYLGSIRFAIPKFHSISGGGEGELVSDAQTIATAGHVGPNIAFSGSFISRFKRKDIELFENSKTLNDEQVNTLFSEKYSKSSDYTNFDILDYIVIRSSKVLFDIKPVEYLNDDKFESFNKDTTLIRVGSGKPAIASGKAQIVDGPRWSMSGGINLFETSYRKYKDGVMEVGGYNFNINMDDPSSSRVLPLESGSMVGDSGSPVYYFDDNKLYYVGTNQGGISTGYGKITVLARNYTKTQNFINSFNEIVSNNEITNNTKNKVYNHNANINIDTLVDTKQARLIFNENASINGSGNLITAGVEVADGKTLDLNINIGDNSIIRKIGKGTININGDNNTGKLHVGDGVVELNKRVSNIKLASGRATINVNADNLVDNNIYFGLDGGKLNLNGYNMSTNEIYHFDEGTNIVNENNSSKSVLKFTPNGNRVYLGHFSGNLDVVHDSNYEWQLRGDSNIKNLNVKNGIVKIVGDNILYSALMKVKENEYKKVEFISDNVQVDNVATLDISRGAKFRSNVNVDGNLKISAQNKVLTDKPKMWDTQSETFQEDENKVVVDGSIHFGNNSNFDVNLENNNLAELNSNLTGNINIQKNGDGKLVLNSNLNNANLIVNDGIVDVKNSDIKNSINYNIKEDGIVHLHDVNDSNFDTTLSKIDSSSSGVLSFDGKINSFSSNIQNYSNLYISSKDSLEIGNQNQSFMNNISSINIGGYTGSIKLLGLENNSTSKILNLGKSGYKNNIIIDTLTNNSNVVININDGVDLKILNNLSNKEIINLKYGSTTQYNLKDNLLSSSEGFINITNQSEYDNINFNKYNNIFIAAKENEYVTLNNLSGQYNFSGKGHLIINANLENRDIKVDGQTYNGGKVVINSKNENFSSDILIQGNRVSNQDGSMTLELNNEKAIGDSANITIKNNGTLVLNSNGESLKYTFLLKDETDSTSEIIGDSNVNINLKNSDKLDVKSKLNGSFNLIYNGLDKIKLLNTYSSFNGSVSLNSGTLVNTNVLSSKNQINLNGLSGVETDTDLLSSVNINFEGSKINLLKNKLNVSKVNINENGISNGVSNEVSNTNYITYKNLVFDSDKKFSVNNQTFKIENVVNNNNNKKGILELKNSVFMSHSSAINNFNTDKYSKVILDDSRVDFRDYNFTTDAQVQKIKDLIFEVKNNSFLSNDITGTGGGAGATFLSTIDIKDNAILTIESRTQFAKNFQIFSKVLGSGIFKVKTIGGWNRNVAISANFDDFKGDILIDTVKGSDNETKFIYDNEYHIKNRIYSLDSNKSLANRSNNTLTFSNVKDFQGEIVARDGNIVLKGNNGILTNANLFARANNEIIFDTNNENVDVRDKFKYRWFEPTSIENIQKIGKGTLTLSTNNFNTNYSGFLVKEGELVLNSNQEFKSYDTQNLLNFDISKNATLSINEITPFNNNVVGQGNLKLFGKINENKNFNVLKLNNTGDLIIENKVNIENYNTNTLDKTLTSKLIGNNNSHLQLTNMNYTFNDLSEYSGKIYGKSSNVILNGSKTFNTESNIKVDNDNKIILNVDKNSNLENISLETKNLEKNGNFDLKINESTNISKVEKIKINESSITLNKQNSNTSYEINKNSVLNILQNTNSNEIINNGLIVLKDNKILNIGKYTENGSITVEKIENQQDFILNVDNANKISLNVLLNDKNKEFLKSNKIKLVSSNRDINLLNKKDVNSSYVISSLFENNKVYLISTLSKENLGLIHLLGEINSLENISSDYSKFKNSIGANLILNSYNDFKDKVHPIYTNTTFKNSSFAKGFNMYAQYNKNVNGFDLNPTLELKYVNLTTKTKTSIDANELIFNSNNIGVNTTFGFKYNMYSLRAKLGYDMNLLNEFNISSLNINLNGQINPEIKLNKEYKLAIKNIFDISYQPLLSESISKSLLNVEKVQKHIPIIYTYTLGVQLINKTFDLSANFTIGQNTTEYIYTKNNEQFKDELSNSLLLEMNLLGNFHLPKNVDINAGATLKGIKNTLKFESKLGLSYNF